MNFIVALCLSQLALIVHKWITMLVLNNLEQKHSLLFHHDGYFLYAHKLDHWKRFQNQNVISFLSSPSSIIVRPLYPLDLPTLLQKHKYIHFQIYRSMNISPLFHDYFTFSIFTINNQLFSLVSQFLACICSYLLWYRWSSRPSVFQNARKHTFIQIPSL